MGYILPVSNYAEQNKQREKTNRKDGSTYCVMRTHRVVFHPIKKEENVQGCKDVLRYKKDSKEKKEKIDFQSMHTPGKGEQIDIIV